MESAPMEGLKTSGDAAEYTTARGDALAHDAATIAAKTTAVYLIVHIIPFLPLPTQVFAHSFFSRRQAGKGLGLWGMKP